MTIEPHLADDKIEIPRSAIDSAIDSLVFAIEEIGGCDHENDVCMCREERALQALKLARGDQDAVHAQAVEAALLEQNTEALKALGVFSQAVKAHL
jgi:hypothetical protein